MIQKITREIKKFYRLKNKIMDENIDLNYDFLQCIQEIEFVNKKWSPMTNEEIKTAKKIDVIHILVDIGLKGDREDGADSRRLPMYEFAQLSDEHRKQLVEYLITPDTLPAIRWFFYLSSVDQAKIDLYLDKVKECEITAILRCARLFFDKVLQSELPVITDYIEILEDFIC